MSINIKRLLSISLALALCFTIANSTPVRASEINYSSSEIEQVESQYTNVTIESLDANDVDYSNAIYVNSLEEYEALLGLWNGLANTVITNSSSRTLINKKILSPAHSLTSASDLKSSDVIKIPLGAVELMPPVYMNIQFNFESYYHSIYKIYVFDSVSNVSSWLSGLQFPIAYEWTQKNVSYDYNSSKSKITVSVTGVIGTTVIFNKLPKLVSQTVTYSATWVAR